MSEPTKGTFAVELKEAQDPVPPWLNLNFYSSPDHLPADAIGLRDRLPGRFRC